MRYHILVGLPHTSPRRRAVHFDSVSNGLERLKKYRCITTAGDNGAINVWRTRYGWWCGNFCRHMVMLSQANFMTQYEVKAWLEVWLPKIHH